MLLQSDSTGSFTFNNLQDGLYQLIITSIGFRKYISDSIRLYKDQSKTALGVIVLRGSESFLEKVTVTKQMPLMEVKAGVMTMNVNAMVTNAGSNVLELLEKMPNVTVDNSNTISLKGKANVLITIDGRPTYITGDALTGLLKSMNSRQVQKIEIMDNPDAKYDASGSAGVINIITTKKSKLTGFNGDVGLGYGQGVYWKTFNSLNLNYNSNKFSLYFNYGFNADRNFYDNTNHQQIYSPDHRTISNYLDQYSNYNYITKANNLKVGADYYISKNTTLGVVFSGTYTGQNINYLTTAYLKNSNGDLDSTLTTLDTTVLNWSNRSVNINLSHQFDSLKTISGDINYVHYISNTGQQILNTAADAIQTIPEQDQLRIQIPVFINVWAGRLDYTWLMKKNLKFEAGIKASYVRNSSQSDYWIPNNSGDYKYDSSLSNKFLFDENINAVYIQLDKSIHKWKLHAGLRFESTVGKGERYGNILVKDSTFNRNYNDLFPSISVNFKASDKNSFNFAAGRRIDRPSYQSLDPFINYVSKYVFDKGNPFLRPQLSYNLEVSHSYKDILFTTINYSYTSDFIFPVFYTINNITIASPSNYGDRQTIGLNVSTQLTVTTWWSMNYSIFLGYNNQSGIVNNSRQISNNYNGNFNGLNSFKLKTGWAFELSGYYNTGNRYGQFLINPNGSVSIGIAKNILKDKGSLKLNFKDIFYTSNFSANIKIDGGLGFQKVDEAFYRKSDTRVVNISFTYRFGKSSVQRGTKKQNSSAEEEQRMAQ